MKRLLFVLGALAALTCHAETWRFVLIGDTPYSDYERRHLPAMMEAIAAEHVDLVVHVGDFKHSRDVCSDDLFADRKRLFDASRPPFVYVPGDNEWSDCGRLIAGHFAVGERLAKLREMFMPDEESLGRQRIPLQRQPGEYREHQRWRLGPVLFLTLNVPGGNNNYRLTGEAGPEAEARMPQVLAWLRESFAIARNEGLAGIVVVMQANPGLQYFAWGMPAGGYRQLLEILREETIAFPGQVLLAHGDTHWQRIDRPLRHPVSGKRLANFRRVETFGYPFMGWVKAYIDPEHPELFRFVTTAWPRPAP